MQTKKQSLIETLTSVFVGWLIGVILNLTVLPLFDYNITVVDSLLVSLIFTVISVVRGYLIRRFLIQRRESMTLIDRLKQERDKCTKLSMDCEANVIQSCINIVRQYNTEHLDINAPLLREKLEHKATKSIQLVKEMQIKDSDTLIGVMAAWVDICIQATVETAELKQYEQTQSEV